MPANPHKKCFDALEFCPWLLLTIIFHVDIDEQS